MASDLSAYGNTIEKNAGRSQARATKPWAYPVLALALAGIGYYIYRHPYILFFLVAVGAAAWLSAILERRHRRQIALSRPGLTICDFAKSFDHRRTDTWILRAVYEEISGFLIIDHQPLPIRADDQWEEDLKIDPEDLDDLAADIALRARRSMEDVKLNPLYGKVRTIRDIVSFLGHQPMLPTTSDVAGEGTAGHGPPPDSNVGGAEQVC